MQDESAHSDRRKESQDVEAYCIKSNVSQDSEDSTEPGSHYEDIEDEPLDHEVASTEKSTRPVDLQRVQSHRSTRSRFSLRSAAPTATHAATDVDSIPDGGYLAWLQVLGSFFLFFNAWGIINSFGVFQTYYSNTLLSSSDPAAIAWIGSVQSFLLGFSGPLMGPLYDAGYFRAIVGVGSFLVVLGHMMLSLCHTYWQVFLAQAICIGLGSGCLFVPSVAILSTYFQRRLATATGLAAAGSSIGGTIYPIALNQLIPQVGFGNSVRILGCISFATLMVSNTVMKVRVLPAEKRKLIDLPAFKEPAYTLFCIGAFFSFFGLYPVFVYISEFALSDNVAATGNIAFYTLAMISAGSLPGRILPNIVADIIGPLNVIVPAALLSGTFALCFIATNTTSALVAFCILCGFASGALVSVPPTVIVSLSGHKRHLIGTRMGMAFFVIDIGLLIGTPIGGWILQASDFNKLWIFSGGLLLLGGTTMFLARTAKLRSVSLLKKA